VIAVVITYPNLSALSTTRQRISQHGNARDNKTTHATTAPLFLINKSVKINGMQKRLIAHVDMDCFYAACEMKKDPALIGFPLIIGADKNSPRGVICTASYEARKFGVRSAMPISQAVRLCPDGIYLRPNFSLYSKESQLIMQTLKSLAHEYEHDTGTEFEQISIDEANLDVTILANKFKSWLDLGKYIRATVHKQTGFSCSVGIAPSRRVAKIAAGYKKPHGVTVVYNMKNFLAPMNIGAIPGIGKKSVPYFESLGIKTIGDLAKKDKFFILDNLGKSGFEYWVLANGQDFSIIVPRGEEQSYSREETYMSDLRDVPQIKQNLAQLAQEVFADLNIKECMYKTVTLKIRYSDFTTITRSLSFKFASASKQHLIAAVAKIGESEIDYSRPIRLLGVKLSSLVHSRARQTSLFDFHGESPSTSSATSLSFRAEAFEPTMSIASVVSFQLQNEFVPNMT